MRRTVLAFVAACLFVQVADGATITAAKTVDLEPDGSALHYTITLTNIGSDPQPDVPGYHEFLDYLPLTVVLTSVDASSGTVTVDWPSAVYWNGSIDAGASVIIKVYGHVRSGAPSGSIITNQGTAFYDSNNDGSNDASVLTDDPATPGGPDPTAFTVPSRAIHATLDKVELTPDPVVAGSGPGNLVYRVTVTALASNQRTAEFVIAETLPTAADVAFVSATTTSGTFDPATHQWHTGFLSPGESATLDVAMTVGSGAPVGTDVLSNTASFVWGSWELVPGGPATESTTVISSDEPITQQPGEAVPTLHPLALLVLLVTLTVVAIRVLR